MFTLESRLANTLAPFLKVTSENKLLCQPGGQVLTRSSYHKLCSSVRQFSERNNAVNNDSWEWKTASTVIRASKPQMVKSPSCLFLCALPTGSSMKYRLIWSLQMWSLVKKDSYLFLPFNFSQDLQATVIHIPFIICASAPSLYQLQIAFQLEDMHVIIEKEKSWK